MPTMLTGPCTNRPRWVDFTDNCVRQSWTALFPTFIVAVILLTPFLAILSRKIFPTWFYNSFKKFLTIHEAEQLQNESSIDDEDDVKKFSSSSSATRWKSFTICFLGLVQTLSWIAVGSYALITSPFDAYIWQGSCSYLIALIWLFTTVYPAIHPISAAPIKLLFTYLALEVGAILTVGGLIYDKVLYGLDHGGTFVWVASICNLVVICALMGVVFSLPLAVPGKGIKKEEIGKTISPQDYCALWRWNTFNWVYPLVKRGKNATLQDSDVWEVSGTLKSRLLFWRFNEKRESTLLRQLWECNSYGLIMAFLLTNLSVAFNYTGPYLMKNILDAIDSPPTPEVRSKAYILAVLMFVCALAKAQADMHYLFFGLSTAARMKSEIMAVIYDKALKRRDLSGIVDDKEKGKGDKKGGADTGKIVNLMSGDATRVSQSAAALTMIYGAPFEIIIAITYLYKLLGSAAFVGLAVLLAFWPLGSQIMKKAIAVQGGLMGARDKRMGVINELIGAIKFIKFFAWERKWIEKVTNEREVEIGWMVKSSVISVLYEFIWTLSPIMVSIVTFFTYIAMGNQLTVSVAFTSITLFSMIQNPMNIIPHAFMQLLQTKVAVDRIQGFLDEEEVTEQVSSLKTNDINTTEETSGLGLVNATLRWVEAEKSASKLADGKAKDKADSVLPTTSSAVSVESTSSTLDAVDDNEAAPEPRRFELKDISVMFPEGELTVVTGPTASGKTALLMALLGELTLVSGRLIMSKQPKKLVSGSEGLTQSISYAAQTPWLRHQSIKDNILFGNELDQERYDEVVRCCALKPDLDMLEDGDQTEIGARGVSLSGGQKARVALARAVYAHTKYVLLDDPLSAVDSHTARFLFDNLLRGPLLKGRTVILVTHHVDLVLPGTHYLIRMLDGRIDTQGTVKDLQAQGALDDIKQDSAAHIVEEEQAKALPEDAVVGEAADEATGDGSVVVKKPRQLVKEEHREVGGVKWGVYMTYLKASSYYVWIFLAFLVVLTQGNAVFEKYWIKKWSEAYGPRNASASTLQSSSFLVIQQGYSFDSPHLHIQQPQLHATERGDLGIDWPDANEHPMFYVGVYAAIGLSTALFTMLATAATYFGAIRASRSLFKQLLTSVIGATMRWYDVTPQGRLLNRFGKDIETIDSSLAASLQQVNLSLGKFAASAITITVVFPWFSIPAILIALAYRELSVGYLSTGRDLRRMESNSKSPIFSDFGEIVEGIVTVRAFSAEGRFLSGIHQKIDTATKTGFAFTMTNRWLLLNFDFLGALSILITTFFALSGYVNAGTAGLCITSAMAFTMSVYWACRFWTMLELDLNSVERIVEYLDLPQEPPAVLESSRPPAYWPSASTDKPLISVENLAIKYAPELPHVLQGVSFTLGARERVGLLGRTGSGKSTLAMSILRFVDPAEGRIVIDGIDISTIGLYDLRSRITFIPQDATLFSGTLRQNLDPFDEHDDFACLDALRRAHLIDDTPQRTSREASRAPSVLNADPTESVISAATTDVDAKDKITLDTLVSAGGANFSQGQRQLIAMARALLRRSSIIVLDEATSSIDFKTDAKIQATIREEFTDSLLLTVAHRLRTVIDYDRLIVLDKGQIVEFDTPYNLIRREDGVFRNMCLKSGTFAELEAATKAK